jgi:hypothetical protein
MRRVFMVAAGLFLLGAGKAKATTIIVYQETITASGTLYHYSFHNSIVTFDDSTDPSQLAHLGGGKSVNPLGNIEVFVTGIPLIGELIARITDPIDISLNQSTGQVGLNDDAGARFSILGLSNPAFASYDLNGPFGPVQGAPIFDGHPINTDIYGQLVIDSVVGNATFQAFEYTLATPEPSTLALGLVGGIGLILRKVGVTSFADPKK